MTIKQSHDQPALLEAMILRFVAVHGPSSPWQLHVRLALAGASDDFEALTEALTDLEERRLVESADPAAGELGDVVATPLGHEVASSRRHTWELAELIR